MKQILVGLIVMFLLGSTIAVGQVIYNNASTAGEGQARGIGNIMQSQGQRNLSNSQAAINLTDARSNQIDNEVKSVNAFWEKNDIYQQHVAQQNYKIEQRREMLLAKNRIPPLTPEEFDRTTGLVTWPGPLTQSQYDKYRNTLDSLLKKRAYAGMLTGDEYMQATAANKEWRAMLTKQKNVYPKQILDQLIRFVLKINREINDNLS